jgi:hypothetical protein
MLQETNTPGFFELLIQFIEVVIWPFTLLIILFFFRKNFSAAFKRLGSLSVDSSGISMTFESVLESTTKEFKATKPEAVAKASATMDIGTATSRSPYDQLREVKKSLESTIIELAKEREIEVIDRSQTAIVKDLENKGRLTREDGKLLRSLIYLVDVAPSTITQAQVNEIKTLYNAI